jgi:hypothetical protein
MPGEAELATLEELHDRGYVDDDEYGRLRSEIERRAAG